MHVRESALRHVRVIGLFSHRMPELPDVTVYMEHLDRLVRGEILRKVRLASPFVVRSVQPPIQNVEGRRLLEVTRLGKRLVFSFEENLFLVLHLMIAGRLKWKAPGAPIPRKLGLLAQDFDAGTVLLTEASPKKRAWLRDERQQDGEERRGVEEIDEREAGMRVRRRPRPGPCGSGEHKARERRASDRRKLKSRQHDRERAGQVVLRYEPRDEGLAGRVVERAGGGGERRQEIDERDGIAPQKRHGAERERDERHRGLR